MIRAFALLAVLAMACRDSKTSAARDERIRDHRSAAPATAPQATVVPPAPTDAALAAALVDASLEPSEAEIEAERQEALRRHHYHVANPGDRAEMEARVKAAREAAARAQAEDAKQAKAVRVKLATAKAELAKLGHEAWKAGNAARAAKNEIAHDAAVKRVHELEAQQQELMKTIDALDAELELRKRRSSKECLENPLAKGCA